MSTSVICSPALLIIVGFLNNCVVQSTGTGRLKFSDFKVLMCSLKYWQSIFKNHTKGTTGILRVERLRDALFEIGKELILLCTNESMQKKNIETYFICRFSIKYGDIVSIGCPLHEKRWNTSIWRFCSCYLAFNDGIW